MLTTTLLTLACCATSKPLTPSPHAIALPASAAAHSCGGSAAPQDPQRIRGRGHPKLSPFHHMRRTSEGGLDVQVDDATWQGLAKIEGLEVSELIRESKARCGNKWYERLREDLVEVLTAIGKDVSDGTVDLELRDLKTGTMSVHAAVPMSHEKRQQLRRDDDDIDRVPFASTLDADARRQDLQELATILREQFAYRDRAGTDLDTQIEAAEQQLGEGPVAHARFVRAIDGVLRAFGDGHTRLRTRLEPDVHIFSPVLIDQATNGTFVAFDADRRGFLSEDRPYLIAIDGVPLSNWLAASESRYAMAAASDAMRQRDAVRGLRFLGDLRAQLGIEADGSVDFTVAKSPNGQDQKRLTLRTTTRRRPIYGSWPRASRHELLDGNIGYLRVGKMSRDAAFLDGLDTAMHRFQNADGLVIDVRGNGGGTRDALRRLFPYFMGKSEGPVVANVAAYRLPPHERESEPDHDGFLANRGLYPADWDGWNAAQRRSIDAARRRFQPDWQPAPQDGFSDWHWFVLSREDNDDAYPFDKPVVLLIDDGCFSATDIFVAPFKGRPGVTILGTPTLGGSGRSRRHELTRSGIEFQASTMASFRPDGSLFEANGTTPDILVERLPTDFLRDQPDTQLETALRALR